MATLENLPEEAIIEILSRLPHESLLRFKSISKFWYALINDPTNSSLQHKYILLKRLLTNNRSGKYESMLSTFKFPLDLERSMSILNVDFPCDEDFQYFEINGHSHGIVCLSDGERDIVLYNPTTKEFRKLPPSIIHYNGPRTQPDDYDSDTDSIGFGYDLKSRDFKVVRVVEFWEGVQKLPPSRVEIYDLSKDRWREIETPVYGHVFKMRSFEMYHDGSYYWWATRCEDGGYKKFIHSFDMSEEVFSQISLPESFQKESKIRSLGVLNGSIVLFDYPLIENEKTFDIWEMEKDDSSAVVSWSKILTIGPLSGIETPLLFVSSDELLMEANEGRVILYNIKTQQFKELPIKGNPGGFQATFFVKSLLSVKGGNNISYGF